MENNEVLGERHGSPVKKIKVVDESQVEHYQPLKTMQGLIIKVNGRIILNTKDL